MRTTGSLRSRAGTASRRLARLGVAAAALAPLGAAAQTSNPGPGLVGLPYANNVERAAAEANQAVFEALDASCNPGGVFDTDPEPAAPPPGTDCNDDRLFVYVNARELVHTANEIRGAGATVASLGQDLEGLGLALRWTAAEEFAAQSSMATEFANGQLSNLAARMNALRFGAGGFGIAGLHGSYPGRDRLLASTDNAPGGADDASGETYSRWGGFVNGAFGYGRKAPTPLEDAFDFDGSELTLGVDYRFAGNLVLGGILGLTEQALDFDEAASQISVVDGHIDSEGASLILFAFFQGERLSLSGSIGSQQLDYEVERNIKYSSFNPDTGSTNSFANSRPQADIETATFGVGYAIGRSRFTVEPFLSVEHLDMTVDAFAEERSISRLSDSNVSKRFDLVVSQQRIESLDAAAGLRFQHVFTPPFGVIVPYLTLEAHRELEDEARTITAGYAAIQDILGIAPFAVATDAPDESYSAASLGFSVVLRGGRQRELDGPIAGGLSGFVQLRAVQGLLHYSDSVLTGGFRYEF